MLSDLSTIGIPVATVIAIVSFVLYVYSGLNKKFLDMGKIMFEKMDKLQTTILDKLEYHERHDDQRFNAMSNDIWAIKVRNAAIDGIRAKNNGTP